MATRPRQSPARCLRPAPSICVANLPTGEKAKKVRALSRTSITLFLPRRGHLATEPTIAPSHFTRESNARRRRPGSPATNGRENRVRCSGLGVEEVVVFELRIGVATGAHGAGGKQLQANERAAPVQDEVAPGKMAA